MFYPRFWWSLVLLLGCAWLVPRNPTSAPPSPSTSATPTSRVLPSMTPRPRPTASPTPPCPGGERFHADLRLVRERALAAVALEILCALQRHDWTAIARGVHPEQGVRFSPDAYLSDEDPRFTADGLPNALDNPITYVWGTEPGTGRPIALTFAAYVERYVYDAPYWEKARLGVNVRQGAGNIIDNHQEFFPGSQVVEFHIPGSEQYGGLDWRSLRLVFLPDPRAPRGWWLVAIVHDEWSP